jgi:phosphoribosyl-dephospho-CoA transferase
VGAFQVRISERLIQNVCGANAEIDARQIAHKINKYLDIKNSISKIKENIHKTKLRHMEELQKLDISIAILQSTCDHPDTERYGDPSGGNDSFRQCLICGKEL